LNRLTRHGSQRGEIVSPCIGHQWPGVAALIVMQVRFLTISCLLICVAAGLAAWPRSRPCSAAVRFVAAQRFATKDPFGREVCVFVLSISNAATQAIYLDNPWAQFKVAGRWTESTPLLPPGQLSPGGTVPKIFCGPLASEACRFHVQYARATLRFRIAGWVSRHGVPFPSELSKRWELAPVGTHPQWKEAELEVPFPAELNLQLRSSAAQHNPLAPASSRCPSRHLSLPEISCYVASSRLGSPAAVAERGRSHRL
jgi:hypothetical protein